MLTLKYSLRFGCGIHVEEGLSTNVRCNSYSSSWQYLQFSVYSAAILFSPGEILEVEGEDNENMCVCQNRLLKLEAPPTPPPYLICFHCIFNFGEVSQLPKFKAIFTS